MNKISFVLHNKIETVDFEKISPTTTLLEFLRSKNNSKGTKEGCNEGDCGACTVCIVEKIDNKFHFKAVNSCVMFLPSVHGKQVITIEDLGTSDNLHIIQQIFVDEHASQCGFCTPGFIMALFAQKAENQNSTKDDLIDAITGNLCRCTGYRPIVDATVKIQNTQLENVEHIINKKLLEQIQSSETVEIRTPKTEFFVPFTIKEAIRLKNQFPHAIFANGGTDLVLRVTKRKEIFPQVIDLSCIKEIEYIKQDENNYYIGAGTKIEDFNTFSKKYIPELSEYLTLFGAKQIRNRATLGGNIATASPIGDILPILFATKSSVKTSGNTEKIYKIDDFITGYRKTLLENNEIISEIIIPKSKNNEILKFYKISKRTNLDISTVSCGFSLVLENNNVKEIILSFGGMAEKTKRAFKTEEFLTGKNWNEIIVNQAITIIETEFTPLTDARSSKEARTVMTKNLLTKFFLETKSTI